MASVTGGPDGTWTRRLNKPGDVLGVNPKASRLSTSQGSSCQDPWPNPADVCYRFVRRYLCDQDWMGVMYPGAGMGGVFWWLFDAPMIVKLRWWVVGVW